MGFFFWWYLVLLSCLSLWISFFSKRSTKLREVFKRVTLNRIDFFLLLLRFISIHWWKS